MEPETELSVPAPVPVESPRRIKPGWYVLAALLMYGLVTTFFLLRPKASFIGQGSSPEMSIEAVPQGLWFPIPGAKVPQDDRFLPTADRPYRKGINQGFVFNSDSAGIPINYGTPVIAAADATVVRADNEFQELSLTQWRALLDRVGASGANEDELDQLRGRQLWLRLSDGRLLRYGHLSNLKVGIQEGAKVYRGQVIAYVGNTGTDDGVSGTTRGARLQFEVWQANNTFFGQNVETAEQVRSAATALFVGP